MPKLNDVTLPNVSIAKMLVDDSPPTTILPAHGPQRTRSLGTTTTPSACGPRLRLASLVAVPALGLPSATTRHTLAVLCVASDAITIKSPFHTPVRSIVTWPRNSAVSPGNVTQGLVIVNPSGEIRSICPATPLPVNVVPAGNPPILLPPPSSRAAIV